MSEVREQIVREPEELAACCAFLEACPHFGFDTEFVGEDSYHPRLCLVQVATDERLFLLDPLSCGPLDAFWNLVVDPARTVIVHAGREEVRLCRLWSGSTPGDLFDLQIAAGLTGGVYPMGHGNLVHQVLGVRLPKGETLTEWRTRPLTASQVRYAFDDVRYLIPLWKKLSERLADNVLAAVLGDLCAKMRLAQNLVANSGDVKALVRARHAGAPLPEESQLTRGWRAEHLLPELLALLDGRRRLRIADLRADGPFAYDDAPPE